MRWILHGFCAQIGEALAEVFDTHEGRMIAVFVGVSVPPATFQGCSDAFRRLSG